MRDHRFSLHRRMRFQPLSHTLQEAQDLLLPGDRKTASPEVSDMEPALLNPPPPGRLLKKGFSCFDKLSMNGKSSIFSIPTPFALSPSKGERRVFKHSPWGRGLG